MAMVARLHTLYGASIETGVDRRAIGKALAGYPPDGDDGKGNDAWLMTTILRALQPEDGGLDLNAERARKTKEEADILAMKSAQARGELLPRDDVEVAVVGAFARVRARLIGIPAKVAPIVVTLDTPAEAQEVIRQAIYEALRELSETNVTDFCGDDGDVVEDTGAAA